MATTILDTLVEESRARAQRARRDLSLSALSDLPYFHRTPHSLSDALRTDRLSVIAEIKKASPSRGIIRESFDPIEIARSYTDAGAEAISVLTEPDRFQGSLDYLAGVREVTHLPLLRKDFIVDPYQVTEALAFGADAILLIASVLDRSHLNELIQCAHELRLSCLVELYNESEMDRIDFDTVDVLGANNRDLRSFEVDIRRASRILRLAPSSVITVVESGLKTSDDLEAVAADGLDAVLIGETLMRESNPGRALTDLRHGMASNELYPKG